MAKLAGSLSEFFHQSKAFFYKNGEVILRPDDTPSGVYFIEKGFVKIYSITSDGSDKLHIVYKEGEIFPWLWVFQNITKDIYYEALGRVVLRRRPKEEFLDFLNLCCTDKKDGRVLFEVINHLISLLDIHIDRLDNLEFTNAYPRIINMLIFLSRRFGKKVGKKVLLDVSLTHKDIASSINMTRETASRELEKLEHEELIEQSGHKLIIKNLDKLKEELESHYKRKNI